MMKKKILPLLMAAVLAASGCAKAQNPGTGSQNSNENETENTAGSDNSISSQSTGTSKTTDSADGSDSTAADSGSRVSASQLFSNRDLKNSYDKKGSIAIKLKKTSASCSSKAVKISGRTITITDEGTYLVSGTLKNGMIIVDADKSDKVQIVLNGVTVSNSTSAAVYVKQADKVFLTTAENTKNKLSNTGAYKAVDENNIDAVIFSKDDLTLNGKGLLKIIAKQGHGIVSKDSLVLAGGSYVITAEKHGLSGKDDICIADGDYQITSGKDGIHAENTDDKSLGFLYISDGEFDITAEGDGISSSSFGQIEGGSFRIQAGGGCQAVSVPSSRQFPADSQTVQTAENVSNKDSVSLTAAQAVRDTEGQTENDSADVRTAQNLRLSAQLPAVQNPPDFAQPDAQTDTSSDTVSTKGIKAEGNLWLDNGTFIIDAADDALHTNSSIAIAGGTYQMKTGDDGIHADDSADISGGTIDISQSYEGIEGKTITISGGKITLTADDDGLNAAGGADGSGFGSHRDAFAASEGVSITISGGTIDITASGDGIDSNGDLTIKGGETYVSGPSSSGNGSLDYNGEGTITGGIFAASGAYGMAQNFGSASTQGAMLVQTDAGTKGSSISLADADGKTLVSWQAKTDYGCVIISCPQISEGNTYTLTSAGTSRQIEMTSLIYGQGSGPGNRPGGMNGGNRPGGMNGGRPDGMDGTDRPDGMDGGKRRPDGAGTGDGPGAMEGSGENMPEAALGGNS